MKCILFLLPSSRDFVARKEIRYELSLQTKQILVFEFVLNICENWSLVKTVFRQAPLGPKFDCKCASSD